MNRRDRTAQARMAAAIAAVAVTVFLGGCGGGVSSEDLTGVWTADDGSGTKTISADGQCTGMYYNDGQPLDIGGPMTCAIGEKETDGAFTLIVRQPPNEQSYLIRFDDADTAVLMNGSGEEIVTLTRQ